MKNKYDIAIIGSGMGGLVSAALLADLDKKIIILEKEPKPGGYLTEFKNNGFTFDVSLHLLNGCKEGCYTYEILKRCGILDDIKFLSPKYLYRSVFPDFDLRIPQANIEKYKELLIEHFPQDHKGIVNLFEEMTLIYKNVKNYISGTKSSAAQLLPYLKNNYETVLSSHISDKKLKAIISQLWIYLGLPPSMLRAIDFCYPWFDYTGNGGYYIENGSYAIVKALVNQIKKKGGEFLFNTRVGRIVVDNGLCKKVTFGSNEIYSDMLISNVDLTRTVHELIGAGEFSRRSIERLKTMVPSLSAFEVFLGLDVDLSKIYPDDYEIFVNDDYDIDAQYKASFVSNANKAPFVITINSNLNRNSANPGCSTVTLIMLVGYDHWISRSKDEYQDKKQKIASTLIKRASKVLPELSRHVKKMVISTPVTFERYTNNLRGAIYGYAYTKQNKTEIRANTLLKIKNLYFASAWARQGSGVAKVLHAADDVATKIKADIKNQVMV